MPLETNVYGIAKRCLIVRNLLSGLTFNAPSDRDGDLPLVILYFLRYFWNLDWTSPGVLDSDISCPPVDRSFDNGSVIFLELILFIERAFFHWIFVVNFSAVKQIAIFQQ